MASLGTEDCCGDEVAYDKLNPKTDGTHNRGNSTAAIRFASVKNPIDDQVNDLEELAEFFERYGEVFVPYSGTSQHSSHSLLNLLFALTKNSPTLGAVANRIKSYAIGGQVEILRKTNQVFNTGEENLAELSVSEKKQYVEDVKKINFRGRDEKNVDPRRFAEYLYEDNVACGDLYVEIVLGDTLGQRSANLYHHSPLNVLYLATEKGKQRYVGVSAKWDNSYMHKHPPAILPVFPAFVQAEDGTLRSMFHVKEGNGRFYGRPSYMPSFMSVFQEYQNRDYKNKATDSQFTGAGLIEIEDDNIESMRRDDIEASEQGFNEIVDRIDKNFTRQSESPQSFMVMSRPYGSKPVFVHEFKVNTSEGWFESTDASARLDIIQVMNWSERLMGQSQSGGFSSNVFFDEMRVIGWPTLKGVQNKMNGIINTLINICFEHLQITAHEDKSLCFTGPFDSKLKELMSDEDEGEEPVNQNQDG